MSAIVENRVGRMRHRLTFKRNLAPRDGSGGFGENWQEVATVWGNLEPAGRGGERFDPDWTTATNVYTATIRHRSDIEENMQVTFGTRVFKVREAPQVDRSDQFMEVTCEEVKS